MLNFLKPIFDPLIAKAYEVQVGIPGPNPIKAGSEINPAGFSGYIESIFTFMVWVAVVLALLMIMVGGFYYFISAGNQSKASAGKDRIKWAIYGLLLALSAVAILAFINPDLISPKIGDLENVTLGQIPDLPFPEEGPIVTINFTKLSSCMAYESTNNIEIDFSTEKLTAPVSTIKATMIHKSTGKEFSLSLKISRKKSDTISWQWTPLEKLGAHTASIEISTLSIIEEIGGEFIFKKTITRDFEVQVACDEDEKPPTTPTTPPGGDGDGGGGGGTNPPLAIGPITTTKENLNNTLKITFSSVVSGGKAPLEYAWSFGDDDKDFIAKPTHTYNAPGEYTVTLTVTDKDDKEVSSEPLIIYVKDNPPDLPLAQ